MSLDFIRQDLFGGVTNMPLYHFTVFQDQDGGYVADSEFERNFGIIVHIYFSDEGLAIVFRG